jgi:phenylacetate-CoA ligase
MIFNPEYEAMDPVVREKLQFARLKNLVEKVYQDVPFYKKKDG